MAQPVPESIDFPAEEEKTVAYWNKIDAFQSSLKQSKNKPRYTFYDGPPFATGLPHYGHILAGTVKDVVTRWAHQSGFHVERRFGWDCHGLPVEYEIDKTLGIKGPDDVKKLGIDKYNQECRKIVSRYSKEWQEIMTRLGRWIDFDNDYKTMYIWFMESVWWVFKQLFEKGMVYQGYKVMPFSTACNTPLSNFESGQNYKEVDDPAVVVSFPLLEDESVSILAWTTTPWTLPSNLACCVHPDLEYVKIKSSVHDRVFILMEARLSALFKDPEEYEILERFVGKSLEGKEYKPLFDYFPHMKARGAWRILTDTYVTTDAGTGIVHQAPYFGEDDYRVCLKNKIIAKDMAPVCPITMTGHYTEEVTHFTGMFVKDADKHIIKHLKGLGRLIDEARVRHNYPFCWRSDTPLIYRAVPSWFVHVEHMRDRLLESNSHTHWVPDQVKEGRFANWLSEARDWAVSRNRYWGTPIPIWISDDGLEVVCVGSVEELKELTGKQDITDLHREFVDQLTIPSKRPGGGVLRRVPEVFDCWFESGSMPFAQNHYPFERVREFEDAFPADFIAEGIDQTRGWFYTLEVLSTALFAKAPFKHLICFGLVLAQDGQKMSKRKQNYPNPMELVNKYGSDAIRLYLINSPAVRAENLRFLEEGVRDMVKDVFLPWYNAYRFFMQNITRFTTVEGEVFSYSDKTVTPSDNYMDRWILSFVQSLVKFVKEEMAAYRLYTVVPRLIKFVDQLTNWFVRMNRRRMKGENGAADCRQCLETFYSVLSTMTIMMAPFIPFLTEHMYQNLKHLEAADEKKQYTDSIHYLMLPNPRASLIDEKIESAVSSMQSVIELGRVIRDRNTMPMKYPLKEVVVIHKDESCLNKVLSLEKYIKEELNVRSVTVSRDKQRYGVRLAADADFRTLGTRLKGDVKKVAAALKQLGDVELTAFQQTGSMTVEGHTLTATDVNIKYAFDAAKKTSDVNYEAHSDGEILVLLDITPDQSMLDEGLAREVINRIQKLRKKAKLVPTEHITVYYSCPASLQRIITEYSDFIFSTIKQPLQHGPVPATQEVVTSESAKVKADALELSLVRGHTGMDSSSNVGSKPSTKQAAVAGSAPFCRFVNVELCNSCSTGCGTTGRRASVLLENPSGDFPLSSNGLLHQVQIIFGLQNKSLELYHDKDKKQKVKQLKELFSLHGSTLYVFTK